MSVTLVHSKHYARVINLMGAYYFGWFTVEEIDALVKDRYGVEFAKASPGSRAERATCDDIIADMCIGLAYSQYGYTLEESSTFTQVQADAAQFAMRDTLEIIVEHMGGQLLAPPTPQIEEVFEKFNIRMVQRMQNAAILQERRESEAKEASK